MSGSTYVNYTFPTSPTNATCGRDPRTPFGGVGELDRHMPSLEFPPDPETGDPVRPSGRGSGGGTNERYSTTEVRHNASISELATFLSQQLLEQGWAADASWIGTVTAGSSWSKQADSETRVQGTLEVTAIDDASYDVMFRIMMLN